MQVTAALDDVEIEIVARVVAYTERLRLQRVARAATQLGNGWLYPFVSLAIAIGPMKAPLRFNVAAMLSLLIAFTVYPLLKKSLRRARPCDHDARLASDLAPLDRYSCPSGHAMTAAAYGVPLVFACPPAAPFVVIAVAVIAVSRVALGHHYVSDVVLGAALGASIAASVSSILY